MKAGLQVLRHSEESLKMTALDGGSLALGDGESSHAQHRYGGAKTNHKACLVVHLAVFAGSGLACQPETVLFFGGVR